MHKSYFKFLGGSRQMYRSTGFHSHYPRVKQKTTSAHQHTVRSTTPPRRSKTQTSVTTTAISGSCYSKFGSRACPDESNSIWSEMRADHSLSTKTMLKSFDPVNDLCFCLFVHHWSTTHCADQRSLFCRNDLSFFFLSFSFNRYSRYFSGFCLTRSLKRRHFSAFVDRDPDNGNGGV